MVKAILKTMLLMNVRNVLKIVQPVHQLRFVQPVIIIIISKVNQDLNLAQVHVVMDSLSMIKYVQPAILLVLPVLIQERINVLVAQIISS